MEEEKPCLGERAFSCMCRGQNHIANAWPVYESKVNLREPEAAQRNLVNASFFHEF